MYAKHSIIINKTGLHARPASEFVMKAKSFESKVFLKNLDDPQADAVNAKSIVCILAESMSEGTHVEVSAEGPDEENAVLELCALIDRGFDE